MSRTPAVVAVALAVAIGASCGSSRTLYRYGRPHTPANEAAAKPDSCYGDEQAAATCAKLGPEGYCLLEPPFRYWKQTDRCGGANEPEDPDPQQLKALRESWNKSPIPRCECTCSEEYERAVAEWNLANADCGQIP